MARLDGFRNLDRSRLLHRLHSFAHAQGDIDMK